MEDNDPTERMHIPGANSLLQQFFHQEEFTEHIGLLGGDSYTSDRFLKDVLSQAKQFDARPPSWKHHRSGYETQLDIVFSDENGRLVQRYVQSLRLTDREHWPKPMEVEIHDLWWQVFSPMAQGETPSAQGLLSLLLLACDGLESIVHTGFAPIEINLVKDVSESDQLSYKASTLDPLEFADYEVVRGDIQMGFPTPQKLRIHLGRSRLLVNIVEVKWEDEKLYYPTFLLDTNSWSLYIYIALNSATIRDTIVLKVAVAVRQMLAWAGVRTALKYYAPPITPAEGGSFGHAMVDVFMIFLILRGWVGLDMKTVVEDWGDGRFPDADLEKSFIIPQRDWALGEAWGNARPYTDRRGPYTGKTQGVSNVIAFLGTVICDHMGLNRREYKYRGTVRCIDDWTDPKTLYDPTTPYEKARRDLGYATHTRTNLGSHQILTWGDVKVEPMESVDLTGVRVRQAENLKRKRHVKEEEMSD